jgi:hypothetical protein
MQKMAVKLLPNLPTPSMINSVIDENSTRDQTVDLYFNGITPLQVAICH